MVNFEIEIGVEIGNFPSSPLALHSALSTLPFSTEPGHFSTYFPLLV
jgi:hypothetical protein